MGHICHHAIIVTAYEDDIERAHEVAEKIFSRSVEDDWRITTATVSPILKGQVNGYDSFCIAPDGSKEGWDHSDQGDQCRKEFIDWLEKQAFEDGSNSYAFAEIQFGDDYCDNKVLRTDADLCGARATGPGRA